MRRPLGDGNLPSLGSITVDPHTPPSGTLRVVMSLEEYNVFPLRSTRLVTIPPVPAQEQEAGDAQAENFAASYVKAEVFHRKVREELAGLIRNELEVYVKTMPRLFPGDFAEWLASRLGSVDQIHTSHLKRSDIRHVMESICIMGGEEFSVGGRAPNDGVETKEEGVHVSRGQGMYIMVGLRKGMFCRDLILGVCGVLSSPM